MTPAPRRSLRMEVRQRPQRAVAEQRSQSRVATQSVQLRAIRHASHSLPYALRPARCQITAPSESVAGLRGRRTGEAVSGEARRSGSGIRAALTTREAEIRSMDEARARLQLGAPVRRRARSAPAVAGPARSEAGGCAPWAGGAVGASSIACWRSPGTSRAAMSVGAGLPSSRQTVFSRDIMGRCGENSDAQCCMCFLRECVSREPIFSSKPPQVCTLDVIA